MKFSKSWVMEWVRTELSDNALAEQITMAGLEVDAVEAVAGQFNNVVVGEVVEINGVEGIVLSFSLMTTVLQDLNTGNTVENTAMPSACR